jgi:heterodisulfide reductase subunit A-like polyferredoxin
MWLTGIAMSEETIGAVLVCGAGITGIQAALDLADGGFKVYLLDSAPAIGGRMSQLDKTFPTGDCAMCILSPRLVEVARNRNIEIITLADIQSVSGQPGSFKVKIRQNPRYVDLKKCDACGDCTAVCPVELPNEFDRGMSKRKAIFRPYPQAIPNVFDVSKSQGPAPCKGSCPAGVNVQGYIALTAAGKFKEAYDLIRGRCPLPAICGRICNHPCEDNCNRREVDEAVSARELERFVADYIDANPDQYPAWNPALSLNARVAVIGSGPTGLTAAADLALAGYGVTVFEAQPLLGGMLRYGIPDFRLPKDVLDKEIRQILSLGVQVKSGVVIDKPKDLLKSKSQPSGTKPGEFDAVLVATGAWGARKMGIPGEDAPGIWEGPKFLYEVNAKRFPKIGPEVLVIGGGDMAMDAARCALRLPGVKSVSVACIENREEMSARAWHVDEALEEGVAFYHRLGPTRVEAVGGKVSSVVFRDCTSVFDEYKKFDPLYDDSAITSLPADTVLVALDQGLNSSSLGLELRPGGRIRVDDSQSASIAGIFAAGDAVLGPSSVVDSIAQGHKAAESMDAFIRGAAYIRSTAAVAHASAGSSANLAKSGFAKNPVPGAPKQPRVPVPRLSADDRVQSFAEITAGYIKEQAGKEAGRCLSCGLCSECMQCVQACSAGAVLHDQQISEFDLDVGSIILSPGIEEFPAAHWEEYGHGRWANVLTNVQFEQMLSAGGPTGGRVQRPSDGSPAKKIAFIQCVGSRNSERGNGYCSSICCMSAAKEAMTALEHTKNRPEVSIFCSDVCASGKEFDKYISRARDEFGVRFVHAMPSRIEEMPDTKNPRVCYISQSGAERHKEFDLVVLSSGIQVPSEARQMAGRLGLDLNEFGFARTGRLSPLAASQPGIYVAGAFQEPKDISESVVQASAAAAAVMEQLTSVRGTMIQRHEYPWERDIADEIPRIGVFVCHCGHNISSVVDVERLAKNAAAMPGVRHAEANIYTCSEGNQQHIKEMIKKHRLNRLVIASCWSRTHEVLFQETLRESGLNQYLLAMTNIRDQCSWVHREDPAAATEKAIDLVSMAVARARHLKALRNGEVPVTASALILGGGIAGMTAALNIAGQGYKVRLIEKESSLGGQAIKSYRTLEGDDVQLRIRNLISKVLSKPEITVHLDARLIAISGQVGNFKSVLNVAGSEQTVEHGAIIVATGGQEQSTEKFFNGKNPRVISQAKLESALAGGQIMQLEDKPNPSVVMVQCVESRDERHPYCSRVCCSEAIKNALEIKKRMPHSNVVILYRDIRTPGFRDAFYQKAREQGVQFIRRPDRQDPEVVEEGGQIKVTVRDEATGRDLVLRPDLLVLSTGIAPGRDNPAISGMLRSALNADGFFQEAHSKLRPVDLSNEGEFLCGLAHSPRFIDETIAQAQAAAGRAARILSKAELEIAGQVAHVNSANCVACATCVKVCPYGAPVINDVRKSEIQGAKCMGCGSCVAVCPARTITLQHQDSRIVTAMLDELLVGGGIV